MRIYRYIVPVACTLLLSGPTLSAASTDVNWNPELTERIFRLPPEQMDKAIQRDFSRSNLAQSLRDAVDDLQKSHAKIEQIQQRKSLSHGEMALEVRHQEILAKKNYLDALSNKISLERRHLKTKRAFLTNMQRAVQREAVARGRGPVVRELRTAVKTKIDSVDIDLAAFEQPGKMDSQNRFRAEYDRNLEALRSLKTAIADHQMNQTGTDIPVDRKERIAYMLNNVDTEIAALHMQEDMLLHMVKLLSLDTMQLAQDVEVYDLESGDEVPNPLDTNQLPDVHLFLSQN